jgi:hypothetical protein
MRISTGRSAVLIILLPSHVPTFAAQDAGGDSSAQHCAAVRSVRRIELVRRKGAFVYIYIIYRTELLNRCAIESVFVSVARVGPASRNDDRRQRQRYSKRITIDDDDDDDDDDDECNGKRYHQRASCRAMIVFCFVAMTLCSFTDLVSPILGAGVCGVCAQRACDRAFPDSRQKTSGSNSPSKRIDVDVIRKPFAQCLVAACKAAEQQIGDNKFSCLRLMFTMFVFRFLTIDSARRQGVRRRSVSISTGSNEIVRWRKGTFCWHFVLFVVVDRRIIAGVVLCVVQCERVIAARSSSFNIVSRRTSTLNDTPIIIFSCSLRLSRR